MVSNYREDSNGKRLRPRGREQSETRVTTSVGCDAKPAVIVLGIWHVIIHRPAHSFAVLHTNLHAMLTLHLAQAPSKKLPLSAPENDHETEKGLTSERVLMVPNDRFDRCHDVIRLLL